MQGMLEKNAMEENNDWSTRSKPMVDKQLFTVTACVLGSLQLTIVLTPICLRKLFPGQALHEKGLKGQRGFVPLFGSQEQSAILVPLINR